LLEGIQPKTLRVVRQEALMLQNHVQSRPKLYFRFTVNAVKEEDGTIFPSF